MTTETLAELLTKHAGGRKEGTTCLLPADADVAIYCALEGETLTISRVVKVDLAVSGLAICESKGGERTAVVIEDVRAVKILRDGKDGAGFGRSQ